MGYQATTYLRINSSSAIPPELKAIQSQSALHSPEVKIMGSKNLQVTELIAKAQSVIRLELVPMARSANALEVFSAIRIPCPEFSNQSGRHDVIDMAP